MRDDMPLENQLNETIKSFKHLSLKGGSSSKQDKVTLSYKAENGSGPY